MSDDTKSDTSQIPPDPIYSKSLSIPIFLAMLAVVASIAVAMMDEFFWRRPYKGIQQEWKEVYGEYLAGVKGDREQVVDEMLVGLDEFKALSDDVAAAEAATKTERDRVNRDVANIDSKIIALLETIKFARSTIAAVSYKAEHAAEGEGVQRAQDAEGAQKYLEEIEEIRSRETELVWMEQDESGNEVERSETKSMGEWIDLLVPYQEQKAEYQGELAAASATVSAARKEQNKWLSLNLSNLSLIIQESDSSVSETIAAKVAEVGAKAYLDNYVVTLKPGQVAGLISEVEDFPVGRIKQIHLPETKNWVDRCETCHLNMQAPLPVNAEDVGGNRLFVSHPRSDELFASHDPQKFGCSMCHWGNGVSITSAETAHGLNHYWLQRMNPLSNVEAGCAQCHVEDLYLEGGERISQAKENFRHYGCWGCHKMSGYDIEPDAQRQVAQRINEIDSEIELKQQRIQDLQAALDTVYDQDEDRFNELEPENKRARDAISLEIAGLRTERAERSKSLRDLYTEQKRVGPNLKDLSAKVRPEWVTPWLRDPTAWRPSTKMPVFRWKDDEEVKDIAAFLWQSSSDVTADPSLFGLDGPRGNAANGEDLFKNTGCLACHNITEGDEVIGNTFAANLDNLGEKANAEYVARWIENPRHRLQPFCRTHADGTGCGRDITPEDYENAGKQHLFSREYTQCPNCGHELQWDNPAVMPSLRFTAQESADVAAYLLGRGNNSGVEMPEAPWLTETERFERGKRWVQFHGCAGCHEIAGLEKEQRIGIELSAWGQKPKERLDFGHYTVEAKRGSSHPLMDWTAPKDDRKIFEEDADFYPHENWYHHRGFAMAKLAEPDLYDFAKNVDFASSLRMPKFNLSGQEILDLVSLLLGSVEAENMPDSIKYNPDEQGQAIREGWWVVRKYNCEGCHQIRPEGRPAIQDVPWFMDEKGQLELPPYLVGTGFRTNPDFLAHFLHDPSLGGGTADPKSLRPYLSTRMPTFSFTDSEIRKLVRFFDAMADQSPQYRPEPIEPLTATEKAAAEEIFTHANCLSCHVVTGVAMTDETKAPNLTYVRERLRPEWIARWIKDPAELQPGTSMPALFREQSDGSWRYMSESATERAKNYKGDHVDLLVRYLQSLGNE